jgi:hypothetical protein
VAWLTFEQPRESPGIKTAVAKAIIANKKKPRLSEPTPSRAVKPTDKASRKSLPSAAAIEDDEDIAPTPWQKVSITESKLKGFRFKR